MTAILEADRLRKQFGAVTAVHELSATVGAGEIFALLGPNGAGKTTFLRMLVGIIRPDAGRIVHHAGGAPATRLAGPLLGYLPEERGLHQDMGILRTLAFFGALRGMARRDAERAALPWLDRLGLAERAAQPVKTLSKGNQQKVQFVAAVLHRPRLAFLDEPFSGLDPVNQDLFTDVVRELRDAGTTVVFSAHQMPLVERLADRVYLVHRGRCVLEGTVPELRRQWHAGERLVLVLGAPADATDVRALAAHPAVERVEPAPGALELALRPGVPLDALLRTVGERLSVTAVRSATVTLHDIYVRTVGGDAAGPAGPSTRDGTHDARPTVAEVA